MIVPNGLSGLDEQDEILCASSTGSACVGLRL